MRIPDILGKCLEESNGSFCRLKLALVNSEFCFVQFYDIIPFSQLSEDIVEKTISCVRAKWDCRDCVQNMLAASRLLGIVSVDSMRGEVDMVSANVGVNLLKQTEVVAFGKSLNNATEYTFDLIRFSWNNEEFRCFTGDDAMRITRSEKHLAESVF